MKFRKFFIIIMIFILSNVFLLKSIPVKADTGPKPTITVIVEGYESEDYLLDLLGRNEEYERIFEKYVNEDYIELQNEPIYQYEVDGWKAILIRTFMMHGDLKGIKDINSDKMTHKFSYRGVPKEFKIIIQKDTDELLISDIVTTEYFNTIVYYNMNTNTYKVEDADSLLINRRNFFSFDYLFRLLITIVVELLLAMIFRVKKWKVIILTNLFSLFVLNIGLLCTGFLDFLIAYIIFEVIVILIELMIYRWQLKEYSFFRLLSYTIIANFFTAVMGLLIKS